MDKREFLKTSGAFVASTLMPKLAKAAIAPEHRTNWAGNITFSTDHLLTPKTTEEVVQAMKATPHLRALGSRHSFNRIADSKDTQISTKGLTEMKLDTAAHIVTVGGGVTYGQLGPWLDKQGYAVHNLASLPHISVVGACMTGTHGSGIHNGNLSTAVVAMEIVKPDGEIVTVSREKNGDEFDGMIVALGSLGLVTHATLKVEPTFQVAQVLYENLPMSELEHNFDAIMGAAYSVSLFLDWQKGHIGQVWLKQRVDANNPVKQPDLFYNATKATKKLHPIPGHAADACTEQLGVPGPWYERLPHFKLEFTPSSGAELQTEYFVPRDHAYPAFRAIESLKDHITPHLFVTEVRGIAADSLWTSMAYKRDSIAFHFTWKPEWPAVSKVLPMIEEKLKPFDARPHWAKLFTVPPARIQSLYPKMADFKALVQQYDPQGKLRNEFVETNLFGA